MEFPCSKYASEKKESQRDREKAIRKKDRAHQTSNLTTSIMFNHTNYIFLPCLALCSKQFFAIFSPKCEKLMILMRKLLCKMVLHLSLALFFSLSRSPNMSLSHMSTYLSLSPTEIRLGLFDIKAQDVSDGRDAESS